MALFLQAIARRLQEKEMKEERKRQKQLEANFEEEYFEDHGGGETTACLCSSFIVRVSVRTHACTDTQQQAAAYLDIEFGFVRACF